jgi:hypothetical protein
MESISETNKIYTVRCTPEQAAEQSRIATAEGLKQVAAALAERAATSRLADTDNDSDDSDYSSDSSNGSRNRKRRRHNKKSSSKHESNEFERRAHYLQLELGNAKVDVDDLRTEVSKLKSNLDPYKVINNELTYLRGAIDRSNKDLELLTVAQIEKRATLYKEEYNEHIALCSAAVSKLAELAEIKVCFMRVLNAERKRAAKAEKSLEFVIWLRKTTYKVSFVTLVSVLVVLLSVVMYWKIMA